MSTKGTKHFYKRNDPPFTIERALHHTKRQGDCLIWGGPTYQSKNGDYGRVPPNNPTGETLAHRFFYASVHGPIPYGILVCHKCDTPFAWKIHIYSQVRNPIICKIWRIKGGIYSVTFPPLKVKPIQNRQGIK